VSLQINAQKTVLNVQKGLHGSSCKPHQALIVTLCSCAINVAPHESRSHTCGKLVACFDAKRAEASAGGSWSDFCQQCKGSQ